MQHRRSLVLLVILLTHSMGLMAQNKSIAALLTQSNSNSIPYISAEALKMNFEDYIIVDARKKEEFEVSHLPGALWAGTDLFQKIKDLKLAKPVVVYCSVGIRSENYGEKLQKHSQKPVYNLYGGIFAWQDAGFKLYDKNGQPTQRVHTFSKKWADYLRTGIPVY